MTRAVLRYVEHMIRHVPDGGLTALITCVAHGCGDAGGPRDDADDAQDWALPTMAGQDTTCSAGSTSTMPR
ncbi:DUF7848 domain-containing protein [Streptomyces lunaelactis]|uniref:DUF7848 domain-containing protein n=1 Tax=Streptomyces lunaelactis TaxID=1535768 RepID=UPI0020C7A056|nr:hypothetical protein [Streptomyces lunaelactis]